MSCRFGLRLRLRPEGSVLTASPTIKTGVCAGNVALCAASETREAPPVFSHRSLRCWRRWPVQLAAWRDQREADAERAEEEERRKAKAEGAAVALLCNACGHNRAD